jgi:hypothetical protein
MSGGRKNPLICYGFWWAGSESNTRHEDFQSSALPTELPAHRSCTRRALAAVLIRTRPGCPLQAIRGRSASA